MATEQGSAARRNKFPLRFFIDDQFVRRIKIDRKRNTVLVYNHTQQRTMTYVWSYVRKHYKPAYRMRDVKVLLNRQERSIAEEIYRGNVIAHPQIDVNGNNRVWWFDEEAVLALHDIFSTRHYGRPRNDGTITPKQIITRAELMAKMHENITLYVKNKDGEFVPLYKEIADWN